MNRFGSSIIDSNKQYEGYTIHSLSANATNYVKHTEDDQILHLTVYQDESTCKLQGFYKAIELSSNLMQFPNPRFHIFEAQILQLLRGVS